MNQENRIKLMLAVARERLAERVPEAAEAPRRTAAERPVPERLGRRAKAVV